MIRPWLLLLFVVSASPCQAQVVPDLPERTRQDVAGDRRQPAWDPLGVRVGAFSARADADFDLGANSNVFSRSKDIQGSAYARLSPLLRVRSDWARHALELTAAAQFTRYSAIPEQNSEEYQLHAGGQLDFGPSLTVQPAIDYGRDASEPGTSANRLTSGTPVYGRVLSTSIAATYDAPAFRTEVTVAYRRDRYEPVTIAGTRFDQGFRATDGIGGRLTFLRPLSPSLFGLVQVVADDVRSNDPRYCCRRNAHGYATLAGLRLDTGGLIEGQVAFGFRHRDFTGTGTTSNGLTYNARVSWYPTELLSVSLRAEQEFRNSGISASNAVLVDRQSVSFVWEALRNLNVYLQLQHEGSSYRQVDTRADLKAVSLRATYTARRALQLSAFTRLRTSSSNRQDIASEFSGAQVGISARVRL